MSDQGEGLTISSVQRFLETHGFSSLAAWLGVEEDAPPAELRRAIERRRRWAQAQQGNPRHRAQALWVIRHHRELVAVMVDEPERHQQLVATLDRHRREDLLARVAEACGIEAPIDQDPLMVQLRTRLGLDEEPDVQPAGLPALDKVVDRFVEVGMMPRPVIEGMVKAWQHQGMGDDHIALLLMDDLNRAGHSL